MTAQRRCGFVVVLQPDLGAEQGAQVRFLGGLFGTGFAVELFGCVDASLAFANQSHQVARARLN